MRKGSREEASKYYNRALHEVRGTNDELGIAVINNGFGEFLYQGRNIAVALEYFKKGLKYAQKAGSVLEARNAYKGLATIYEELGDYKNALECFKLYKHMADSILNTENTKNITREITRLQYEGEIIIKVEILPDTGMLKIFVSDEGAGIPDDKLDEVFDKFAQVQVKESGTVKSTGLGLTFCKIAVHAHGGEIRVESDLGKGSTFWFTLCPANSEETVTAEIKPVSAEKNLPRLTEKEKEGILAYLNQLRETKIYHISRLRKILSEVDAAGDENIKHWKDSVENAIYLENKEEFKMLVE